MGLRPVALRPATLCPQYVSQAEASALQQQQYYQWYQQYNYTYPYSYYYPVVSAQRGRAPGQLTDGPQQGRLQEGPPRLGAFRGAPQAHSCSPLPALLVPTLLAEGCLEQASLERQARRPPCRPLGFSAWPSFFTHWGKC